MTTKRVSLIIVLCLALNNAAVFGRFETPVDVQAPVVESAVFGLVSLIRLPFTVTAGLMQEKPLLPEYRQIPKKQDSKKMPANKKDNIFFFTNTEKDTKNSVNKQNNFNSIETSISAELIQGSGVIWVNLIFYWLGFKYIFLLACLMALSKSSLPWEIRYSYA